MDLYPSNKTERPLVDISTVAVDKSLPKEALSHLKRPRQAEEGGSIGDFLVRRLMTLFFIMNIPIRMQGSFYCKN